jgi:hypothetical protein
VEVSGTVGGEEQAVKVAGSDVFDGGARFVFFFFCAIAVRWRCSMAAEGDLTRQELVGLVAVTQTTEHAEPERVGLAVLGQRQRVGRPRRYLRDACGRVEEGDAPRLEAGRLVTMTQSAMQAIAKREDLRPGVVPERKACV